MKKRLAILGSTGSIGTQALDVVAAHPESFSVEVLSAQQNHVLLATQARTFLPSVVIIGNEQHYPALKDALADLPISVQSGQEALNEAVRRDTVDTVLGAIVGFA